MSATSVVPVTAADIPEAVDTAELEAAMALIACGTRSGKTNACDRHNRNGPTLLRIASTGALDALASTICGSERTSSCSACVGKAQRIMDIYNKAAE